MELPLPVRMTGLGLRFYVDDEGRGSATPAMIRGQLWPLDTSVTDATIREHLRALAKVSYVELYTVNGRKLLSLVEWPAIDRGKASDLPPPPSFATASRSPRAPLAVVGGRGRDGRGDAREWLAEAGAGGTSRDLRDAPEPSPFCKRHQPFGSESACGPCASARKLHDAWLRAQTEAASEELGVAE